MTAPDATFEGTRAVAERVHAMLQAHQLDCVVIGAMALAVHHYPRATEDFDLAIATPPSSLEALATELRSYGWEVALRMPDAQDPLGGVIDVRAPGADLVQLVNFDNAPAGGFPRLVREAVERSVELVPGSPLRVADLETLIAFKLYSGGAKSQLDILELLDRNPQLDLESLRKRCASLRLSKKLDKVVALRASNDPETD